MKVLVVYDSLFGNTEAVAKAVAEGMGGVKIVRVDMVREDEVGKLDVLVVGSPTHGGKPKKSTQDFLERIPYDALKAVRVAAFDTRMDFREQKIFLKLVMKIVGYAAPRIADGLKKRGGKALLASEGFLVEGREGPLREGELERARLWGEMLLENVDVPNH